MADFETALKIFLKPILVEVIKEILPVSRPSHLPAAIQTSEQPRLLWSALESSKALGISRRFLWSLTNSGQIPSVRLGGRVCYDPDALREWVKASSGKDIQLEPSEKAPRKPVQPKTSAVSPVRKTAGKQQAGKSRKEPSTQIPKAREDTIRQPRSVAAFVASKLGISEDRLPLISTGDIRRAAGLEIGPYHAWVYHGGNLPEEALQRIVDFYASKLGPEQ